MFNRPPTLRGWLLVFAVWLVESALGSWLLEFMWRQAGIQQALRDIHIQEAPTYQPLWRKQEADSAHLKIEDVDAKTRASIAAYAIPGKSVCSENGEIRT